jgi:hypothetical protein
MKIGQEMWKARDEIDLHPAMNYDHRWAHLPETHACWIIFGKKSYNEFYENPTDGFVSDARPQTEERVV